jgi:hypothetical protein
MAATGHRHRNTIFRPLIQTAVASGLLFFAGLASAGPALAVSPVTVTFTSAGEHQFTVPAGVTSIHVVAIGGQGGFGYVAGGLGARVDGDLTVTPGQTLFADVGGTGSPATQNSGTIRTGGFGGGGMGGSFLDQSAVPANSAGESGAGGGGASDIGTCAVGSPVYTCDPASSRLLVAAGGGGAGAQSVGGAGGTPNGARALVSDFGTGTGGGATTSAGGTAGYDPTGGPHDGSVGGFGWGGGGGHGVSFGGGGGGGGWYGGGSGAGGTSDPAFALSGGGGGGSSYGPTGTTYTNVIDRALVTIIYLPADVTKPTVTITTPASDAVYTVGAKVVVTFACADETSLASCTGTFPNGSLLDASVGQVGGHIFTVTAVDKAGNQSSLTRRYTVKAGPIAFDLRTVKAPNAHLGKAYRHRFVATGTPTPKVSLAAGKLPPGLKLAADGTLSGKPTRVGTYKLTLVATNGVGTPAKIVVSVKVVKA